ncbi:MAG: hypothetical protein GY856_39300 [bacterium]|nr:hypothetical protein [bacterium]
MMRIPDTAEPSASPGDPLLESLPEGRKLRLFKPQLALLGLTIAYGLGAELFSAAELNATLPLLLLVTCLLTAIGLIGSNPVMIVSPLFWFFVVCAVYYGSGPLVYHYGSPASIAHVQGYYHIDEITLLRTNLLNTLSILTVTFAFSLGIHLFPFRTTADPPVFHQARRDRFILFCLVCGAPIRYVLVPLHNQRMLGFFVPSQILNFHRLMLFAIMLMVWSHFQGDRKWRVILVPLLAWEFLLRFSGVGKLDFFLFLLPIFIGFFLARPRLKTFAWGVLLGIFAWVVITNVTGAVRRGLPPGRSTLGDRITVALSAMRVEAEPEEDPEEEIQSWWTRLSYSAPQGFCLDGYDGGRPGNSYDLWYWAFVPRLLVPSKPEMTLGKVFNIEVTGNPQSKSAPGIFAEAYWNGGWTMTIAVSAYVGLLFVVLSHLAIRCFRRADYRWLPLVWSGMFMGLRVDDFAVSTYLGSWPIALSGCLVLYLVFPRSRVGTVAPGPSTALADHSPNALRHPVEGA